MKPIIIEFKPGKAKGTYITEIIKSDNIVDTKFKFELKPIKYVGLFPNQVEGKPDWRLVMGSNDGKHFNIIFGLEVDGENIEIRIFRNMTDEEVASYFGIQEGITHE